MWRVVLVALLAVGCRQVLGLEDPHHSGNDGGETGETVIGGSVSGLTGGGLVLLDNGSDDILVSSAQTGQFGFATPVANGSAYDVTVGTQPTNPSQTCTVTSGSGVAHGTPPNVAVTCTTDSFTVGGNVAGFAAGGSIELTNNGTDNKTITGNGIFTFATPIASGRPYDIEIKSQSGETCSVVANVGTVGDGPIKTALIVCGANNYSVGGTPPSGGVTGLDGTLQLHNGGDTLPVSANGAFAFPTPIQGGGTNTYNVTIGAQPSYPPVAQKCLVQNGAGTVGTANITNVQVSCVTSSFSVGGSVSGLAAGVALVLANGTDTKIMMADGTFTFGPIVSGHTYAITVMTQPAGQHCAVAMGSGTVKNADVTNVAVTCAAAR